VFGATVARMKTTLSNKASTFPSYENPNSRF